MDIKTEDEQESAMAKKVLGVGKYRDKTYGDVVRIDIDYVQRKRQRKHSEAEMNRFVAWWEEEEGKELCCGETGKPETNQYHRLSGFWMSCLFYIMISTVDSRATGKCRTYYLVDDISISCQVVRSVSVLASRTSRDDEREI